MNNIFDTHAHLTDSAFDIDRESLLGSLAESGICGVTECGTDIETSKKALLLSEKYSFIYAAVGIHPEEVEKASGDWLSEIEALSRHEKCVAIGEIGLDYHYTADNKELQKEVFSKQIELANKRGLPIIVHDREAHEDCLNILKKYRPKGVMHCFSGSVETAKEILNLGMYIGLGGAVTFKNAKKPREVAAFVPENRLLLETDCPYMAPVPMRGARNNPLLIPYSAEVIAEVKNLTVQELLSITAENAGTFFGL